VSAGEEYRQSLALFSKLGIDIDPDAPCSQLTVAQQQSIEIAKSLEVNAKIIVMDEPTAALTSREVKRLFAIIRDLKSQGIGIIYVSHRLEEIFEVADSVMVLRDGEHVDTRDIRDTTRDKLIEMMVGRPLESEFPRRTVKLGHERLRVEKLNRGRAVRDVSFNVRAGEVLGFTGLVGAGRTETMRIVFGADEPDSGKILIEGTETVIHKPKDAIRNRICLLAEDRKQHGLILIHSARENFGLPNLDLFGRGPFLSHTKECKEFDSYVQSLRIRISDREQLVMELSGGNQQKVVLAKWLARNADIIIFDEPTRGIDVGAKYEIHLLINRLASQGKAIIMISSELPEILGMSDRIIVMHEGQIKGEITDVANTTQQDIISIAIR
ncbi:MAG: sugar ABC transporter ATP-binding protein, partial [Planctomycetota bacterium]